ncbi:heavy-metal-associated domain-containing protein [Gordonia sp. (in: high G+C Gram-positive bacteria)]|uniref:heavy-metal-associated domain-containing protein n=1 Tax=Gordonia sp. (in: high G+C Gram-positive bacteria) TaxID=84139 RepID=UPI0039E63763
MNAPARLSLFAVGLLAVFGAALLVGRYVVPDQSNRPAAPAHGAHGGHGGHSDHAMGGGDDVSPPVSGTSSTAGAYALTSLSGPATVGQSAPITFTITSGDRPLTAFTPAHEKELHLIVVRSDGAHFAHLHPTRDSAGAWSTAWTPPAAGAYRVFADFVPGDRAGDEPVVLSSTLEVGGDFAPVVPVLNRTSTVDGLTVTLDGTLAHGGSSTLTAQIRRNGRPVALQPYLGALGHLVLLRAGDLAYNHVHPLAGTGSDVPFAATAPSAGRYLAYLDFQVDGTVHTAPFVLDAQH